MWFYRNWNLLLRFERTRLAKKKFLRLEIPYPLSGEGQYFFGILLEDLNSLVHSRSRSIVETRR